jgi:hypothetical protein
VLSGTVLPPRYERALDSRRTAPAPGVVFRTKSPENRESVKRRRTVDGISSYSSGTSMPWRHGRPGPRSLDAATIDRVKRRRDHGGGMLMYAAGGILEPRIVPGLVHPGPSWPPSAVSQRHRPLWSQPGNLLCSLPRPVVHWSRSSPKSTVPTPHPPPAPSARSGPVFFSLRPVGLPSLTLLGNDQVPREG